MILDAPGALNPRSGYTSGYSRMGRLTHTTNPEQQEPRDQAAYDTVKVQGLGSRVRV